MLTLENVFALERLDAVQVGHALGITLKKFDRNKYFNFFFNKKTIGPIISKVELRVPGPKANSRDGLLIMTIDPSIYITTVPVVERFGEPEPDFVMSDQGETVEVYYCYKHHGCKLSFEISKDEDRVLAVIIDRTENY